MTIQLNHTIVPAHDKKASAEFLAHMLGLEVGTPDPGGYFVPVETGNGVTLDFMDSADVPRLHFAFLISEKEFDDVFSRITEAGLDYYGTPGKKARGEIFYQNDGRGVYFDDPNGHTMEVLTAAYDFEDKDWHTGPCRGHHVLDEQLRPLLAL